GRYGHRSVVVKDEEILVFLILEEFGGNDDVSGLVLCLVRLRNIDIAAGNRIQRAAFHGIQVLEFYAVIGLSIDLCIVDVQALACLDYQAAVVTAGNFIFGKGEITLTVKVIAVGVQRNLTVLVDNVAASVSIDINTREVGV